MVKVLSNKVNLSNSFMAFAIIFALALIATPAFATSSTTSCYTTDTGYDGTCTSSPNFQVNVSEFLTIELTTPAVGQWASGAANTLLVNTINVKVYSNNGTGYTAFMNSKTSATLTNVTSSASTNNTISALPVAPTGTAKSSIEVGEWGYSLNDTTYYGMSTSPIEIFDQSGINTSGKSQDVYFGAKASATNASGTYSNTVVFSVISGVTTPAAPVNPATPDDPGNAGENPTYNSTTDRTVYDGGSTTTNNRTTTTTTVNTGDTRSTYASAAGVTTTNIGEGTPLATGLAVTAAVAATSGLVFFVVAKRRKDDDEDEDY